MTFYEPWLSTKGLRQTRKTKDGRNIGFVQGEDGKVVHDSDLYYLGLVQKSSVRFLF